MNNLELSDIDDRIGLLEKFYSSLSAWFRSDLTEDERAAEKSFLNRNLIAARNIVREAGTFQLVTVGPPPAIGGIVPQNVDPFGNLFTDFYGASLAPIVLDCVEQAIGVYAHLSSQSGMVSLTSRSAIDVESAIERALRPTFREKPPASEKEVQDAVENVFNSLGLDFTRERDIVSVGGKAFKPDFIIRDLDVAVEVKLTKGNRGKAEIQEEINADISAYKTKWKNLLFIIYDLGAIADPYQFRTDNVKLFGVSVTIIKH